jgi:uncharacterized repeat protein (TIGR03803 family)
MRLVSLILCGLALAGCSRSSPALLPTEPDGATEPAAKQSFEAQSAAWYPLTGSGYKSLYSFGGVSGDGVNPLAGLKEMNGVLYGTTLFGGTNSNGTIFAVNTSGHERVIYRFKGAPDGEWPAAGLIAMGRTLYGTTELGGSSNCNYSGTVGCGSVFAVSTSGKQSVIYRFKGGTDGRLPLAGLLDVNRTFYGTTYFGGANGLGTVFAVSASGKERVLYSFKFGTDGAYPEVGLIAVNGSLYGTTYQGGSSGWGTVFKVSTSGKESVVYSFKGGADGAHPEAALIEMNGVLYGTTGSGGGARGAGTVFAVSTSGKERVLHSFRGAPDDGAGPTAPLIALNGTLYGTTETGGANCPYVMPCGTIFSVTTAGKETLLYRFKGKPDGQDSAAGLIDVKGVLYGTTELGGTHGNGTIYKILP